MLKQLLNKIRGIDPFYEDIRAEQIALYQHYFDRIIAVIDIDNNTERAQGGTYDEDRFHEDDDIMANVVVNEAQREGLSGCYLQIMVNQYFFADVWMREADKDQWVKRVLQRRKADYFPSGWAVFRALGLSC